MATKTHGQNINELSPRQFLKLGKVNPSGSLEVRKLASGAVTFYWRVTLDGKTVRKVIGMYDPSAPPKSLQPTLEAVGAIHRASGHLKAMPSCRGMLTRAGTGRCCGS